MSKLYIVPTPIGNLEDITLRAIRILKEASLILAEDTRKTGILLKHYGITTRMISFHKFNEFKQVDNIIEKLSSLTNSQFTIHNSQLFNIALVSDAGTPGISDPGYILIKECIAKGIEVETLPGPTALIPALVNSGFVTENFLFIGFLPVKKGRQTKIKQLVEECSAMIFYESPHRLVKTLEQFSLYFSPDRQTSVSRELSKIYEENKRGTLTELIEYFKNKTVKGEIVIVVSGRT